MVHVIGKSFFNHFIRKNRIRKLRGFNLWTTGLIALLLNAIFRRLSGVWVFRGTRVPVSALFENLEDGAQLSEFISWFPGVTLQQARAVLEHVADTLEAV